MSGDFGEEVGYQEGADEGDTADGEYGHRCGEFITEESEYECEHEYVHQVDSVA